MNTKLENNTTMTNETNPSIDNRSTGAGLLERRSFLRGTLNTVETTAGKAIKAAVKHNLLAFRSTNIAFLAIL